MADLHRAWNAVLPEDVAVLALSLAPPGFHPRYDALSRTYAYTIWNHPVRSVLFRRTALWVRQPLDLAAMSAAAQLLVGSHDFGTFGTAPRSTPRKQGAGLARPGRASASAPSTVRRVLRATWSRGRERRGEPCIRRQARLSGTPADPPLEGPRWQGLVEFTIEANAFLYHMVRSMVGTLLQVGRGDWTVAQFSSAFDSVDRARAGPTAAPQGLCLIGVEYPALKADTDRYKVSAHQADTTYRQENQ